MRISDWSSDVCSSDLLGDAAARSACRHRGGHRGDLGAVRRQGCPPGGARRCIAAPGLCRPRPPHPGAGEPAVERRQVLRRKGGRSEEHTSELQSLMRISYAVFCLKKKKNNNIAKKTQQTE